MANNTRNAGRKKAMSVAQIEEARNLREEGVSVTTLAKQFGVSRQTMSGYLQIDRIELSEDRQRIRLLTYWKKLNELFTEEEWGQCNLRIEYLYKDMLTTTMLVNFRDQEVYIRNHTDNLLLRAFGMLRNPSWKDFQEFLEERALPRGRDELKKTLTKMGLNDYDPLSICEKTRGRILGDYMHMKFYYYSGGIR